MKATEKNHQRPGLILSLALSIIWFTVSSYSVASEPGAQSKVLEKPVIAPLGDANEGKSKAATCTACHGTDGNSSVSNFPKIAGQNEKYLYKQLKEMKLPEDNPNARPVPEMTAIVASLSDQDMKDLASYYAIQTPTIEGAEDKWLDIGERLYRSGNQETGAPACTACHGPSGSGLSEAGIPSLSGQHAAYTSSQLRAFRAAGREDIGAPKYRANDGETKTMRNAVKALSDKEIEAVSNYISGLH